MVDENFAVAAATSSTMAHNEAAPMFSNNIERFTINPLPLETVFAESNDSIDSVKRVAETPSNPHQIPQDTEQITEDHWCSLTVKDDRIVDSEEAIDDEWCTSTNEDAHILDESIIFSAKAWPANVSPKHWTFKEEVLSLNLSLGERTWNRVESECLELLKYPVFKRNGIELDHLIALSLFFGDYKYHQLQQYLVKCLSDPICIRQIRSIYHWKTSLESAFVKLNNLRRSASSNTVSLLNDDMNSSSIVVKYMASTLNQIDDNSCSLH